MYLFQAICLSLSGLFLETVVQGYYLNKHKKLKIMSSKAPKTRYSDVELKEFQDLIESKLTEARQQLSFYTAQLSDRADNADSKIKGLDDGIGTAENERMTTLAARLNKHILHLENAKLRIQNKVYGICRVSGKLISKERLRAVPHATLSIAAKQNKK